ncbi:MAG TPA: hypothetical protein VMU78_01470 [Methylocella sp.]|nr:hypothetical protein [Methylocella sp.]
MRFNLKTGFVRLAVVFFVGWWLVWGYLLYRAVHDVRSFERAANMWQSKFELEYHEYGHASQDTNYFWDDSLRDLAENRRWLQFVEKYAFGGFFAIIVVFASGVWIWRGLRSEISN